MDKNFIELFDGEENIKFKIIDTFGVDDKNYAVLLPEDGDQLYVLEIRHTDNEIEFLTIDDDEEFDEVIDLYEELKRENDEREI